MPGVFSHGSIHGLREDNLIFQFSRPYGHKLRNFAEALLLQIYTLIWSPQPHDHEQLVIYKKPKFLSSHYLQNWLTVSAVSINKEAFPLILCKYPVPLYSTTVNSNYSIRPFSFWMTFSVFLYILSILREWSSTSHSPHHSIHGYFSLNK